MRIILLMIEPPLPFGNAAGRWYYVLLRGLVARGHDVTALASCSNPSDATEAAKLFPPGEFDLRCYPTRSRSSLSEKLQSFLRPMSYLFSSDLRRGLREEVARGYDVLHLEQLFTATLAPRETSRTIVNVHFLFDIDSGGAIPTSLKDRVLQRRICRAEKALLRRMQNISVLTPRLSERVRQINSSANISTIPLSIDASLYPLETPSIRDRPTVGLIGSFNWGPTLHAAQRLRDELWPEIKRMVPHARLTFVGRSARKMLGGDAGPDIVIHEDVPDALPFFRELDVLLYAPPAGSGMKVKILEAMLLGTPVVTNDEGVEGLPVRDSVHAGVANANAGLIERAVECLTKPRIRQRYRAAARQLVETHCSPTATLDRVEQMYQSMLCKEHAR
jgi:glycosyltransferase involved in cell wall biosynthesis